MQYKILIVDDDIGLLNMLKSYFEIKKYLVITAEHGAEALKKIDAKPDIILLDINMPQIRWDEAACRPRSGTFK